MGLEHLPGWGSGIVALRLEVALPPPREQGCLSDSPLPGPVSPNPKARALAPLGGKLQGAPVALPKRVLT